MTDNPLGPVTFTAEEKAMLAGTAEVKLEETTDGVDGVPESTPESAKADEGEGAAKASEAKPEAEEEEGEEEVTEVADGTNPDAPARRKVIAFSAYEKQRQAKKALAEEATKLREQVAYLSGLAQNPQQPKPQQQAQQTEELSLTPPDKTKEPEKYLAWLETGMARLLKHQQQTTEQSQQSTQFQQINQTVFEHEQAFINGDGEIEPHPDFHDAVKFLQDRHKAELKEAGYEPHEIQQIMAARAQSVALKALQAGKSPAERVYSLAKLNGYKKATPKTETEAEKIARQAESQKKAGKTISALPGGESKGGLTAETLANMDPAEFLKMWNKGEAKALMGWKD
jgi:hypothetical protein